MSLKGKLAKFLREVPIGALYRALVVPLITVGGFWGKLLTWLSPRAVDKIEGELDEALQEIETADKLSEAIDETNRTGDQRPIESAIDPTGAGSPSEHRDGVQTRPRRKHRTR